MANFSETLQHNADMRAGRVPRLSVRIEQTADAGHVVHPEPDGEVVHFEKHEGPKMLTHIAKHLGIPHEVIGKTHGEQSQEPEKEADED